MGVWLITKQISKELKERLRQHQHVAGIDTHRLLCQRYANITHDKIELTR